jgi:hypothetical protein
MRKHDKDGGEAAQGRGDRDDGRLYSPRVLL